MDRGTALLLGLIGVLLSSVLLPEQPPWLALKGFALAAGGVLVAVWVFSQGEWSGDRVRGALLAPVNVLVLCFLAWVALSLALSPLPPVSRFEALRHLGGALVYFATAYGLASRDGLQRGLETVAAIAAVTGVVAFATYGEMGQAGEGARIAGAYRNEQPLGAFLCLALPLVITAAASLDDPLRRTGAQIASVIVLGALMASRNRSAWLGGLAGLAVLGIGWWRVLRPQGFSLGVRHVAVPVAVLALCLAAFLFVAREGELMARRTALVSEPAATASLKWREGMWDKALRMVRDRPLLGHGVGLFPLQQALYHHPAAPSRSQASIAATGAGLDENAHNQYLQLAAELGIPGLLLYLGVLTAFTWQVLTALRREGSRFRRWALMGTLAAVSAQAVSALASPAWEFPECSLFLWLTLGLGMSAARVGE